MFDEQVCGPDLPVLLWTRGTRSGLAGVVVCHVVLQFVRIGPFGGLPVRLLRLRLEIVGQILGLGMAHLPWDGQACFWIQGLVQRRC